MKRSKRYSALKEQVDSTKVYSIEDAVRMLVGIANSKFNESVEVHMRTGIDPKQADQQIRGTIILPHGTGKEKRIAVFAEGEKQEDAKAAGADVVGGQELIDKIKQTKEVDFDVSVATPEMMKKMASVAKVLGPKGLMPSPKTDTVTVDIKETVEQLKKGKLSFKNDTTGNLHQLVGKVSFGEEKLRENIEAFVQNIKDNKPTGAKGEFIKSITITSTMGVGIKVNL
ncbi:MAG: 50S ribosomal protein L1 [Candidatus Pacebacteria bacterium]|nr:50S ribosomal protein L1 [Candidatus Paceibacterota bacterium]